MEKAEMRFVFVLRVPCTHKTTLPKGMNYVVSRGCVEKWRKRRLDVLE